MKIQSDRYGFDSRGVISLTESHLRLLCNASPVCMCVMCDGRLLTCFSGEADTGVGGAVLFRVAQAEARQTVFALVAGQRLS